MPPSKSPAKTRPTPPQPVRRTARSTKSPSRLGQNDNWGTGTPTKWVSDTVATQKAKEEELYQERIDFVAKLNAESDEKKGPPGVFQKYKTFMTEYKWSGTIVQTVVLTLVGFAIGQQMKNEPITAVAAGHWAGWGVINATCCLPYLMWLSTTSFGRSARADAVLKALFNQVVFSQLLNALFITYWALLKGKDPLTELSGNMLEQAKLCACFWLPSDLINMYLVPVHAQMLWNATLGVAWSAVLAYIF